MPYRLTWVYENGSVTSLQPLACDSPASEFGFEDRSIFKKGSKWAKELTKGFKGVDDLKEVICEHYEVEDAD